MAQRLGGKRGDSDKAVHHGLFFKIPVCVGSHNGDGRVLYSPARGSRVFTPVFMNYFCVPPAFFRESGVHPDKERGPVLRVLSSGARIDRKNGASFVVFSRKKPFLFQCRERALKSRYFSRKFFLEVRVAFGNFGDFRDFGVFFFNILPTRDLAFYVCELFRTHFGAAAIGPKFRISHFIFNFFKKRPFSRNVKASPPNGGCYLQAL